MAKGIFKMINTKKSSLFWTYFIIGVLVTAISVLLMPFWKTATPNVFFAEWGHKFVKIIIAVIVLLYAFLFLLKRIARRGNGVVKALSVVEFAVLILISLGLLISQFSKLALDAYVIISIALWMRGVVEIFRAYYWNKVEAKYPVYKLVFAIILASVGAYFFSAGARYINNLVILWIATIFGAVFGIIVFILGFMKKPAKIKR